MKSLLLWSLAMGLMWSNVSAQQRHIPLDQLQSGLAFSSPEVRGLQLDDDFASPSAHAIDKGAQLWKQVTGSNNKSCASCHGEANDSMKGAATRYPAIDKATGKLFNLEDRIRNCRSKQQKAINWLPESDELLAITLHVTGASKGMPITVSRSPLNAQDLDAGQRLYEQRIGQLNLSCAQCHSERAGLKLGGNLIPEAHPTGYPIYRLEWQTVGSLQRRLRNCMTGVRAEPYALGSKELTQLELFLMWRARGMPLETPGVRP
jgi:sulfur-oxidizing protein SoxA